MNRFKSAITLLTVLACFTSIIFAGEKNFSFSPEKPVPGAKITITYNPQNTILEKSTWVKAYVYQYRKNIDLTEEYDLVKNGNSWSGSFNTTDTSAGIVLRFKGEEGFDDNNKKLYLISLYDNKGNVLQYNMGGLATGYMSWFQAFDLDPDLPTAYNLLKKEFELFPASKKDFISIYVYLIRNVNKENAEEVIAKEIEEYAKTVSDNEDDKIQMMNLYRSNRMVDKATALENEYKQKYPDGKYIPVLKFQEYRMLKSSAEKIEFLKTYENTYKIIDTNNPFYIYINYMYNDIISTLQKENNIAKAVEFLKSYNNANSMLYNSLAWSLYEANENLNIAEELALKGVELAKEEVLKPKGKRPQLSSTKEWEKSRKYSLGMLMDTYAAILLKLNKNADAEKAFTQAVELTNREEPELNERYAACLLANGKYEIAKKELEEFFKKAVSTSKMRDIFKKAYIKTGGKENEFDAYFKKFEDAATEKLMVKLSKDMINEPAPQFTLVDLEGKNVSLSDFKGKVVIVDFWATWCGPCLASFPGMKEAVEKYESTGKAKFLFVNTWENVEDKVKNASDFIKKNSYPFHVLMDEKNEVVSAFKVSGIPTKFIIDGNGNVRFKSVGFSGNTSEMVEEIGIMIKMIQ
jgi:peroxiredoxin